MRTQIGKKLARLGEQEFRAEDGRISCTDMLTGAYATRSIKQSIESMEEVYANFKQKLRESPSHYRPISKFLEEIAAVILEAKEQGDPDAKDMMDERVRRRRRQIFIP